MALAGSCCRVLVGGGIVLATLTGCRCWWDGIVGIGGIVSVGSCCCWGRNSVVVDGRIVYAGVATKVAVPGINIANKINTF